MKEGGGGDVTDGPERLGPVGSMGQGSAEWGR